MANGKSNFPTAVGSRELEQDCCFFTDNITSITELAKMGKPTTTHELEERLDKYFSYCAENGCRVGIEGLALACGCDRSTFWRWCHSDCGKDDEWVELCQRARQQVIAFFELAMLSGRLSPPVGIFCLKNVAGWKDAISFEDSTPRTMETTQTISAAELPRLGGKDG